MRIQQCPLVLQSLQIGNETARKLQDGSEPKAGHPGQFCEEN